MLRLWGCATPERYVSTHTCVRTTACAVYEVRKLSMSRCLTKGTQAKILLIRRTRCQSHAVKMTPPAKYAGRKKKKKRNDNYEKRAWYLPGTCVYLLQMRAYTSISGEHNRELSFCYVVLVGSQGLGRSCTYKHFVFWGWYSAFGVTDVLLQQQEYGDTKTSRDIPYRRTCMY